MGIATLRISEPHGEPVELPATLLEKTFSAAANKAREVVLPNVNAVLDDVYRPVYAAIPAYADFHYSVYGEYSELGAAVLGQVGEQIEKRLFAGFEQRLQRAGVQIDEQFVAAYRDALDAQVRELIPPEQARRPLGDLTRVAIDDALSRARITLPIGTIAAVGVGSGALKALTLAIAKKIGAKIAAKAALKGAAKGTGVLAGAGAGALACSWSGPGAAACGAVGGAAAWLAADHVIIKLDEYFNRDEFEDELRLLISQDRAQRREQIQAALQQKAQQLDEEVSKAFTLREHAGRAAPAR